MPLLKLNTSHVQSLSVQVYMTNSGKTYQDFDKFQDDVLSFALGRGF